MNFISLSLVALALLNAEGPQPELTVQFSYWAARATSEQQERPQFDRELEPIKSAVSDLPFDTYRTVKTGNAAIKSSQEQSFKLDDQYQLNVRPVEKDDHGRIKVDMKILETEPGKKPKTALAPSVVMQPDKMVKMRGLKLRSGGELVLVVRVR